MTTNDRALRAPIITIGLISLVVAACGGASPSASALPSSQPSVPPSTVSSEPTSGPSSAPPSPSAVGGWQPAGSMVFARLGARAALLKDGSLLVVGNEPCVAAGEPTQSERAEVYDPSTDTWAEVDSLNKQRDGFALVALRDGTGMVLGGSNAQSQPFSSTKIYRPATHTWSDGPLMQRAGAQAAVTLADGRVVAVGPGHAEVLDAGASAWRRTTAPPAGLAGVDQLLSLADGTILANGESSDALTVFLTFDPEHGRWRWLDPDVLRATPVALPDGTLLALGDDESGAHVQRYNRTTGTWEEPGQMAQSRIRGQVTVLRDGRVFVAGGVALISEAVEDGYAVSEGSPLASSEIYDPATDAWSPGPSLLGPRQGGHAVTLADGSVLVFGGYVESPPPDTSPDTGTPATCPTPLATTERLQPAS
jgi:hypothetical protein